MEVSEMRLTDLVVYSNSSGVAAPVRWEDGILALNIVDHTTMVFFTLGI